MAPFGESKPSIPLGRGAMPQWLALPAAAAALIASISSLGASPGWSPTIASASQHVTAPTHPTVPVAPLVLTPPDGPGKSVAHTSHRSHSSHSSHSSHYSGGGGSGGHRSHASHTSHYSGGLPSSTPPPPARPHTPPVRTSPPAIRSVQPAQPATSHTVLKVARTDPNLALFVQLVKEVQAESTLEAAGPWIVFIPRDRAFDGLPKGALDTWRLPANVDQLKRIVRNHVVSGSLPTRLLTSNTRLLTLSGARLRVEVQDSKYRVQGRSIATAPIMCDNGVILLVDDVFLPPVEDVLTVLEHNGCREFVRAAKIAGLDDVLRLDVGFTVFAPSDAAFAAMTAKEREVLYAEANRPKLRALVERHFSQRRLYTDDVIAPKDVATFGGKRVRVEHAGTGVTVNGITLRVADLEASNGVVNIIDSFIKE